MVNILQGCWIFFVLIPECQNAKIIICNYYRQLLIASGMARSLILIKAIYKRQGEHYMKNKIVTAVILISAVTLLSVLAFYVRVGATADSVAVLKTAGMTCGSCSGKIIQALEKVHGVAVTEVDVEGGWVIVGYDTKVVKPEGLAVQVNSAGFASSVHQVLTPEQFKQVTGRDIGKKAAASGGCCGSKGGGCNSGKQS